MSVSAAARPAARPARRVSLSPFEGWFSLLLVAAMAALVCWSIDDGAWILGRGEAPDLRPWG